MNGVTKPNGLAPRPRGNGVLYAATCSPLYVELAFLSAVSMRERHPHVPILLFTDQPAHPLSFLGAFTAVLPLQTEPLVRSLWSRGQLARIYALLLTPFERTLHLDADTRVVGDVMPAFAALDRADVAMVECVPERSLSRRYYGGPMYSAGFASYRLAPNVKKLLMQWAANSRANFICAGTDAAKGLPSWKNLEKLEEKLRHQFLGYDQTSLVELLSPDVNVFGVRSMTLPYEFNCTLGACATLPRIVTHDSMKHTSLPDLLAVAQRWRAQGRGVQAKVILQYVAARWLQQVPKQESEKA